ncbi:MAG TPA: cytochrome c-type biogenesis CcmF C-terminal domain-containing protein [Kofleriaceae bacterium]|jgi:cytochrome c-type biogenesis protein CcmF
MSDQTPFSPIALVGTIALLCAYAVAAWCVAAGIAGNARKNRKLVTSSVYGLYGFTGLVTLASVLLIYAFCTHDFTIKYVAQTSDVAMPTWYKVTAFWGGLDGSLLLWVLVLALFSTVAIATNHRRHRDMIGFVVGTIMVVQVFFLSLLIFTKNPFSTFLTTPPVDGQGLNPLLQNYWMVIHPPSLYTGFVAATIPFAFGVGALASGRLDDLWLGSVRVWMLICFGFLSLGLILGGRWAYEELGWGGYWAWDPVENAGLMPWFTATAFLHSAIIQEQRGMMKRWNLVLVVATFFLTIFGTFMTRSGAVQSVHAFGEDNVLALQFIVFMALILIVSIGLIIYRSPQLGSKMELDSFLSREFAFLVNNWILLACAVVVVFLTMYPTITEAVESTRISVGIPTFNRIMTGGGLSLLFLAGAAPLLAWRRTTVQRLQGQFVFPTAVMLLTVGLLSAFVPETRHQSDIFFEGLSLPISLACFGLVAFTAASIGQEFWRGVMVRRSQTGSDPFTSLVGLVLSRRRKYGGYIVHLGVAILFVGFAGKAYDRMLDRTIERPVAATHAKGASSFQFGPYSFVYEDLIKTSDDHKDAVTAQISIWKGSEQLDTLYPAKWDFRKGEQASTEVGIHVRLGEDVYVVLTGYDLETGLANFRVYLNPLILWVWIGFMMLAAGTLVCLIPQRVVDMMSPRPKTKLGRAADVAVLVLFVTGLSALVAHEAHAAPAAAEHSATEHVPAGMGMGDDGVGYAAMNRPRNDTEARAMKEILCVCGCPRESIYDCKCATAAKLRAEVQERLADPKFDLKTSGGREMAYNAVLETFMQAYGGEAVLVTPRGRASWLFPVLAVVGGGALLATVGRRIVKNRAAAKPVVAAGPMSEADEAAADQLDDELRDTD